MTVGKTRVFKAGPRMRGAHWRLMTGGGLGLLVWAAAWALGAPRGAQALLGWDAGAAIYLILMWSLFLRADEAEVRSRAAREDEGRSLLLVIVLAAILASLIAVVNAMLAARTSVGGPRVLIIASAGVTLALSWLVLQTVFVPHYAHRHFGDGKSKGCIGFPGEPPDSYMDFVYLAFTIGATFQVSDNTVLTSGARRLITAHAAAAYVFNTAILALGINIIASVVGK